MSWWDISRDEASTAAMVVVWLAYFGAVVVVCRRAVRAMPPLDPDQWRLVTFSLCGASVGAALVGNAVAQGGNGDDWGAPLLALAISGGAWWLFLRGASGWVMLGIAAAAALLAAFTGRPAAAGEE